MTFSRSWIAALTIVWGFAGTAMAAAPPSAGKEMPDRPAARMQSLDKVTARTSTFDLTVGETKAIGSLRVTLRACRESLPVDPPESAAFVEVVEVKPDEKADTVFSGWMFASSPALSAMEHPIFDIWVLSCVDRAAAKP